MMKTVTTLSLLFLSCLAIVGCNPAPTSSAGFRLPDGDAEAGLEAFLYMQCNQCHTIKGMDLPTIPGADPPFVQLGGKVTYVKTYGELVTSIINPSHELATGYAADLVSVDGESKMYDYNRHMTVQELIDLVAFLQSHYDVVPPQFDYRMYPR
jgi:mono/diheme cytochrome c family protein